MALGKGLDSLISAKPARKQTRKETNNFSSQTPTSSPDKIWQIPLADIVPNTEQPRKHFSHKELEDLVHSIKQHGIIQPITVTEKEDGGFELIAGERRLRAAEIAGFATISCIVTTATQQERLELALIENLQREDLNPIEEAFSFDRLIKEFGLKQKEVGEKVGKSRPYVANTVRLLGLPEEIKRALVDKKITFGKARALLSLKDPEEQIKMYRSMVGESLTTRDVERKVANKGSESRKGSVRVDPNLLAQEQVLEDRFGTKVMISKRGQKGKITIEFNSNEEFKQLMQDLS